MADLAARSVEAWLRWPAVFRHLLATGALPPGELPEGLRGADRRFHMRHRWSGVPLRAIGHPSGRLGVRREGCWLDVEVDVGPCTLVTIAGRGALALRRRLPETVLCALPGRPLSALVDHPAVAIPGLVVGRAQQHAGSAAVVEFDALERPMCCREVERAS